MVTSTQARTKYGDPIHQTSMVRWEVPQEIRYGAVIPKSIYCNRDMIQPLTRAFSLLITTGYIDELKTWDGCFNIRKMRGLDTMSLHSWGIAVDVNAATNPLGAEPTLSPGFVKCWTDAGFDWGGTWKRKDGMHFQLHTI
jgi:hypothetical protein